MTSANQERLYQLLPAFYRELDEHQGQQLRALMAVLESEFRRLEEDMAAMYDDWFITTCDDWVVPYIADLFGIHDLKDQKHLIFTQRRRVANTIGYRRRKGTSAALEHVIRDVTGWHARCVEFARQVAGTQHITHTRPDCGNTVDVRQFRTMAEIDRLSGNLAHTLDMNNSSQGKYNVDRIGLFLYRLRSYPIRCGFACPIEEGSGRFTFDLLGRDIPLFNQPEPVTRITHPAQSYNLPLRLSRGDLAADLHAFRSRYNETEPDWRPANSRLYGPDRGLYVERDGEPVPPMEVAAADLSGWPDLAHLSNGAVAAIDVELGRLAFVDGKGQGDVRVNYNYGFGSEIGGGPYGRQVWLEEPAPETHEVYVAKRSNVNTLGAALGDWEEYCARCAQKGERPTGRITILDNGLYEEAPLYVYLPEGARLTIAAGDGVRPIIKSDGGLWVTTVMPSIIMTLIAMQPEAEREEKLPEHVIDRLLRLNGLFIDGGVRISPETLEGKLDVRIEHCTLMPDGLCAQLREEDAPKLRLNVEGSITGSLHLPVGIADLAVRDSIIDHSGGYAIAAPEATGQPDLPPTQVYGPAVTLKRTTVFGKVSVQELSSASEVIFTEPVFVKECKRGGVSFSYVPAGSQTPPREFCQPPDDASTSRVRPAFTSVRFGDPAYAQLGLDCPSEIRRGGNDGTEMGVFCHLHRPQREINLEHILDEYLPFGMSAAISYVT